MWSWTNIFINFTPILEPLNTWIVGFLEKGYLVLSASQLLALPSQAAQKTEDILRAMT
jgi:hypothetical protein